MLRCGLKYKIVGQSTVAKGGEKVMLCQCMTHIVLSKFMLVDKVQNNSKAIYSEILNKILKGTQ